MDDTHDSERMNDYPQWLHQQKLEGLRNGKRLFGKLRAASPPNNVMVYGFNALGVNPFGTEYAVGSGGKHAQYYSPHIAETYPLTYISSQMLDSEAGKKQAVSIISSALNDSAYHFTKSHLRDNEDNFFVAHQRLLMESWFEIISKRLRALKGGNEQEGAPPSAKGLVLKEILGDSVALNRDTLHQNAREFWQTLSKNGIDSAELPERISHLPCLTEEDKKQGEKVTQKLRHLKTMAENITAHPEDAEDISKGWVKAISKHFGEQQRGYKRLHDYAQGKASPTANDAQLLEETRSQVAMMHEAAQHWQKLPKWLRVCGGDVPVIVHADNNYHYPSMAYLLLMEMEVPNHLRLGETLGYAIPRGIAVLRQQKNPESAYMTMAEEVLHIVDHGVKNGSSSSPVHGKPNLNHLYTQSQCWEAALKSDLEYQTDKAGIPKKYKELYQHLNELQGKGNTVLNLLKENNYQHKNPNDFWNDSPFIKNENPRVSSIKNQILVEALPDIFRLEYYVKKHLNGLKQAHSLPDDTTSAQVMTMLFPSAYALYVGPEQGKKLIQNKDGEILEARQENIANMPKDWQAVPSFREFCEFKLAYKYHLKPEQVTFDFRAENEHTISKETAMLLRQRNRVEQSASR